MNVLGHDGNTLGMDGAQVGVLEEANKVCLSSLLQSKDGRALESQVGLEVLGNLTNQPLERKLADEELSGLLVPADFTKGDGAWAVPVGLLDSSGGRRRFAGRLGGELLSGGLASSGFTGGLLSSGHFEYLFVVEFIVVEEWNGEEWRRNDSGNCCVSKSKQWP